MRNSRMAQALLLISVLTLNAFCAFADNLHRVDSDSSGFRIYRSGAPSKKDFKRWCKIGIQEVVVLAGNAEKYEDKFAQSCPGLNVIYNVTQNVHVPLDIAFLNFFDAWVTQAKLNGTKILFRCNCGCHRTGRLAAYYEMRFKGKTYRQAKKNFYEYGKDIERRPGLVRQVKALRDFVNGTSCTQKAKYCVTG